MFNAQHSRWMKIIAVVVMCSVLIFFFTLPIAMFGGIAEKSTNQAVNSLDSLDGSNDFTPGSTSNQTGAQKVYDAFDGSGKVSGS